MRLDVNLDTPGPRLEAYPDGNVRIYIVLQDILVSLEFLAWLGGGEYGLYSYQNSLVARNGYYIFCCIIDQESWKEGTCDDPGVRGSSFPMAYVNSRLKQNIILVICYEHVLNGRKRELTCFIGSKLLI